MTNKNDDQDEVIVKVELHREGGDFVPQSDEERFAKLTRKQLDEVAATAQRTGGRLIERLKGLEVAPSKVALEFGISAGGEVGVPFVTKGTLEAQFKVTIEWTPSAKV